MDQISRLIFDVQGRDRGGSKVLNDAAAASDKAHAGFSKLGNTLSGLGGPFEAITNYAGQIGDALEQSLSKAQKFGLALTATGVGLTALAAKDQQAQSQLRQAIDNTGASYGDYEKQIEEAVKAQENFGHTANDTYDALNAITTATQDPRRALAALGDVANIAAEKHESLAEAAGVYVKASQGQVRALLSLGIRLDGVGSKTGQINRAMAELHDRLAGQAAASVDTFAGRLKAVETRLHDQLAALGKYGPQISVVGAALTVYASVLQLKASRQIADTLATEAETKAEVANAAARLRTAEAAGVEAAAIQRAAIAQGEGALGGGLLGRLGGLGALTRGGLIIGGGLLATDLVSHAVGGSGGHVLSNIGTGASIGAGIASVVPGVGTVTGALVGAGVAAAGTGISHLVSAADPANAQSQVIAQMMAGGKGEANLAKLHQIAANQMKQTGSVSREVSQEITQLTAALDKQKTATNGVTVATRGENTVLRENTDQLLKHQSALLANSQGQDDLRAAARNMATTVAQQGSSALRGNSDAAIANRNALRGVVSQAESYLQTLRQHGASAAHVAAVERNLASAIKTSADNAYGDSSAVQSLLRQLGFLPSQIDAVTSALLQMDAAWNPITGSEHRGLSDFGPAATNGAKNAGKHLAKTIVAAADPVITSGVSSAATKGVNNAAQTARNLEQNILSSFTSIRQQIQGTFDVGNLPTKTDLFGTTYTAGRVDVAARQYVRQLETWSRLLGQLRKKGLNEVMLDQIEQAGVAAIPVMQQILHDHEIGSLNRSERAIGRIGTRVAGAQIAATQGGQLSQLEHILSRLPDRQAQAIEKGLSRVHITVDVKDISHHQGKKVRVR